MPIKLSPSRLVFFWLALIIVGVLVAWSTTARGATLYEQTEIAGLSNLTSEHPGFFPAQRLGTDLNGPVGSISYKVYGSNLAPDFAGGYGEAQLFACASQSYLACTVVAHSNFSPQVIFLGSDYAFVRIDMSAFGYSFDPGLYYYIKWLTSDTMALYGTTTDTYLGGEAAWIDVGALESDTQLFDFGFRVCSTNDCDFRPPPKLTILTTITNALTPTISGNASVNSEVGVGINGQTYTTTPVNGEWSITLPPGDALAEGVYSVTAASLSPEGILGSTAETLLVDATLPSLVITAGPAEGSYSTQTTATYTFLAEDPHLSATQCAWDGLATSTCSSPTETVLSQGAHRFTVLAFDTAGNVSAITRNFVIDSLAPTLAEVASIPASTDTTPTYQFTSSEAGTLSYLGACSASTASATAGTNTITFNQLAPGTYSNCQLQVTDAALNSAMLAVTPFTITTAAPPPATQGYIVGVVFEDHNGNGKLEVRTERGISGFTVYLDLNSNGTRESTEPAGTSGLLGLYSIKAPLGTYTMGLVPKTGWIETSLHVGTHRITIRGVQITEGTSFGVKRK